MKKYLSAAQNRLNQRGINMVDLMMWLVIAALLLAAALQGIGYYQKASYLYSMKNDASNAGTASMAQVTNEGKITEAAIAQGTEDTKKTTNIDTVAQEGADDANGFVIRSSSPSVPDQDVLFLSHQRGGYAPGIHVVAKDTVIDGNGLATIVPGGSPIIVTPPAGGGGGEVGGGGGTAPILVTPAGIPQSITDYFIADINLYTDGKFERGILADDWADFDAADATYKSLEKAIDNDETLRTLLLKIESSSSQDPTIQGLVQNVNAKMGAFQTALMSGNSASTATATTDLRDAKTALWQAAINWASTH